jgi:putative two-component system response regulator
MAVPASEVTDRPLLDAIQRMACLAEYQKQDVSAHVERIRGYCFHLARGVGLPLPDVETISYASQLHDIGEISLPAEIFSKADQLTTYEWELVRRHPLIGAELLHGSPSVVLQAAEIIALTHHERWDGSGYPHGLKGEAIPLSGRICGLADIFDALTTPRQYKKEIPVHEAYQMILDSGVQLFGSELIRAFRETYNDLLKVRQNNLQAVGSR